MSTPSPSALTKFVSLDTVLQRLGIESFPAADFDGLRWLMLVYKRAIPFENLDPLSGQVVTSELGAVVQKIITQRRGGWCFEMNQLFSEILRLAGFDVTLRLARVSYRRPGPGPLTHTLLTVALGGQTWLVDVGFGGPSAAEPLPWAAPKHITIEGSHFRQQALPNGDLEVLRQIEGAWERLYQVVPMAVQRIDLEMGSQFLSRWELSPFRRMLMCVGFDGQYHWCSEGTSLVQRNLQWQEVDRQAIDSLDTLKTWLHKRLGLTPADETLRSAWQRWQTANESA